MRGLSSRTLMAMLVFLLSACSLVGASIPPQLGGIGSSGSDGGLGDVSIQAKVEGCDVWPQHNTYVVRIQVQAHSSGQTLHVTSFSPTWGSGTWQPRRPSTRFNRRTQVLEVEFRAKSLPDSLTLDYPVVEVQGKATVRAATLEGLAGQSVAYPFGPPATVSYAGASTDNPGRTVVVLQFGTQLAGPRVYGTGAGSATLASGATTAQETGEGNGPSGTGVEQNWTFDADPATMARDLTLTLTDWNLQPRQLTFPGVPPCAQRSGKPPKGTLSIVLPWPTSSGP